MILGCLLGLLFVVWISNWIDAHFGTISFAKSSLWTLYSEHLDYSQLVICAALGELGVSLICQHHSACTLLSCWGPGCNQLILTTNISTAIGFLECCLQENFWTYCKILDLKFLNCFALHKYVGTTRIIRQVLRLYGLK